MCVLEHFSLPFKRISSAIGENVGNHSVAFTKINITIKMKLVKACRFLPQQGPSSGFVIIDKSFPSIGLNSLIDCMMDLKWILSHFPFGFKDL